MNVGAKNKQFQQPTSHTGESPDFVNAPTSPEIEQRIRQRAYELSRQRQGDGGDELSDWYQAEAEIRRALDAEDLSTTNEPKRAAKGV